MSEHINAYFENAQVSLAAYAALDRSMVLNDPDYIDALRRQGMSEQQAKTFASASSIVDQRLKPILHGKAKPWQTVRVSIACSCYFFGMSSRLDSLTNIFGDA